MAPQNFWKPCYTFYKFMLLFISILPPKNNKKVKEKEKKKKFLLFFHIRSPIIFFGFVLEICAIRVNFMLIWYGVLAKQKYDYCHDKSKILYIRYYLWIAISGKAERKISHNVSTRLFKLITKTYILISCLADMRYWWNKNMPIVIVTLKFLYIHY